MHQKDEGVLSLLCHFAEFLISDGNRRQFDLEAWTDLMTREFDHFTRNAASMLNSMVQVCSLPAEILSEIFRLVAPRNSAVVASVCSRWRAVALAAPYHRGLKR